MTFAFTEIDFVANNARIGGGEVMLLRMATAARELGIDVRVVGPDFDDAVGRTATAVGLPFVPVPGRDRRAYLGQLARLAGTWRTRLVWCNGLVPAVATAACRAPRVVHVHQAPTPRQAPVLRAARRRSLALVVPSPFLGTRLGGARVLENWTEDAPITSRPLLTRSPVTIGFLGRVSPIKGVGVLAEALRQLEHRSPGRFELVVAGDDRFVPARDAASLDAQLRGGARITRTGWIDPDELFARVDLVAVPSVWDEPFGLVAAEAMARGIPVVVTRAGALPDIVGDDHPWVVPPGDASALADAIDAVAADRTRAQAVAAAGRARWEQRYAPARGRDRLASLLAEL